MTDASLIDLILYVSMLGIVIEALYQRIKLLWQRRAQAEDDQRKPMDLKDELIPVGLGVLVVLAFWPHSLFGWLTFHPRWPWLDVLFTAVLVSRGANLAHESYRDFGKLLDGLVGRIWRPLG